MTSKFFRTVALSMAALLAVISLAACSNGGTVDSSAAPDADTTVSADVSADNQTADNADAAPQIKSDKVYKIATDVAFKPFSYTDENDNQIGFDIDLFRAIAEDQGINFEFQPLGFEGACAALETSQADGAICCLNIKEERKLKYDFSDPYYTSSVVVMVKEDSGYEEFSDLAGKTIGAKIATDAERYASDIGEEVGSQMIGIENFVSGMMMLDSGNVDAIVDDITVVKMALAEKEGYKIIGEPGYSAEVGFAVPKDKNPELVAAFNQGLKNVRENGKYDELIKEYIG